MELAKSERINNLLELYKDLLTKKQQEVMDMYFLYDLSLAEIAENNSISRNAIHKSIKSSSSKLYEYEEKLGLYEKKKKLDKIMYIYIF